MPDQRHLRVLEAAEALTVMVLGAAERVDGHLAPGIRGQLLRATSSISANIAEAAGLGTQVNFLRQLRIALASANEVGSHLRVLRSSGALDGLTVARLDATRRVVCKMLVGLIAAIESRLAETAPADGRRRRRSS